MRAHSLLFASSFLFACSSDQFVAPSGDIDSSTVDGGLDAKTTDAPSFETAPPVEAGCMATWCTCFAPKASFCDDFDKPNEMIVQGWSEGVIHDNNTILDLVSAAQSPPKALHGAVPSAQLNRLETGATTAAGSLTKPLTVAFDFNISGGANCANATPEFARVSLDTPFNRQVQTFVAFGLALNGATTLYLATLANQKQVQLTTVPTGMWVRVRLQVALVNNTLNATVAYAQAGLPDDTPAQMTAGAGSISYNQSANISYVSMGMLDFAISSTGACEARIDNVAFYQQ